MKANINEDELKMLAYLHEHAQGYTKLFTIKPNSVTQALCIGEDQLRKDASYLADHGLIGVVTVDTSSMQQDSFLLIGLWLTGNGENYMRELEAQPGMAHKITATVVKESWSLIRDTAVQVLSDFITRSPH